MARQTVRFRFCKRGHDKNISGRDRLNRCRECQRIRHRAKRKKLYGITGNIYDQMISDQGGKCAICRQIPKQDRFKRGFVIDHCHSTGMIRGLLCNRCNLMIGWAKDDSKVLMLAVEYLDSK